MTNDDDSVRFIYYTNHQKAKLCEALSWAYSIACHLVIKNVKIQPPTDVTADFEGLAAARDLKASICTRVTFTNCKYTVSSCASTSILILAASESVKLQLCKLWRILLSCRLTGPLITDSCSAVPSKSKGGESNAQRFLTSLQPLTDKCALRSYILNYILYCWKKEKSTHG